VIALSVSSFIIVLFMLLWPGELLFMLFMILLISSRVIGFVTCLSRLTLFMLAEAYGIVLCVMLRCSYQHFDYLHPIHKKKNVFTDVSEYFLLSFL